MVEENWNINVAGTALYRFTKRLNNIKRVLKPWSKKININKELRDVQISLEKKQEIIKSD